MSVRVFRSLRTSSADRLRQRSTAIRAREMETRRLELQMRQLVTAIPTKALFDEWVGTFPAEYQADIRQRFEPFCTFPRADARQQMYLDASAALDRAPVPMDGREGWIDGFAPEPVLNDFRQMGRLLDEDTGE